MNVTVHPHERVRLQWILPFDTPPATQVVLPMRGDELSFTHNGQLSASFTRVVDKDCYWLGFENGKWVITFDTNDTSFLLPGDNRYEFVVLDADGVPVVTDEGTVTFHG